MADVAASGGYYIACNANKSVAEPSTITGSIGVFLGKPVVKGSTFARVSYNIPGQQQRFAGDRGLRDAENRAAKVIADNIQSRLASHFAAASSSKRRAALSFFAVRCAKRPMIEI